MPDPAAAADHFAALGLPRRAALSSGDVKTAFQEKSRSAHPDSGGDGEAFARLTDAQRALSTAAGRLRHLLDLEHPGARGAAAGKAIAPDLMDAFAQIGGALQAADAYLAEHAKASSQIAKAMLAGKGFAAQKALLQAGAALQAAAANAESTLAHIDALRGGGAPEAEAAMLMAWGRLSLLEKWSAQLKARNAQLAAAL
ncbi:MAG: hypothetical protein R3F11_01610 [Verrucomicrobiales bacterium]